MHTEGDRYKGKPLLIILELYILSCIEEITSEQETLAKSMVHKLWGDGDDWKGLIRQKLKFKEAMDGYLKQLWVKRCEGLLQAGLKPSADEFAKQIVDANFAKHIHDCSAD